MSFNFNEWKKWKISKGEWLPYDEYIKKKNSSKKLEEHIKINTKQEKKEIRKISETSFNEYCDNYSDSQNTFDFSQDSVFSEDNKKERENRKRKRLSSSESDDIILDEKEELHKKEILKEDLSDTILNKEKGITQNEELSETETLTLSEESELSKSKPSNQKDLKRQLLERYIILDVETTGVYNRDKIIEIALLEIIGNTKTGRHLHYYLNPEINVTFKASYIHTLTNEKLEDKPLFKDVAQEIVDFIGTSKMIAHNAGFDMRMLNNELERVGLKGYSKSRFIDTLKVSRFLYNMSKHNQDALCLRFDINNHMRNSTNIHSALEDVIILYKILQHLFLDLIDNECDIEWFTLE